MSRPGVVPAILRRSRLQPTLDIWAPPPKDLELAADVRRVKARLAERAAANVIKVQARLAQRAATKASTANVAAIRTEASRDPRVDRQTQQHATSLESKKSSLEAIRRIAPARFDKSCAVQSEKPRNEPAGGYLAPHPTDIRIVAPVAPRATRLRTVDVAPLALSLPRTPKVALKSILRGGACQQKRRVEKKVSFRYAETKEVSRWIGIEPGTEPYN